MENNVKIYRNRGISLDFIVYNVCLVAFLVLFASCGERNPSKNDTESQDPTLEALNKKIKANPDDASLYYQRADYLLSNGNLPDALMNFLVSLDLDSTSIRTWSKLSDVYMLMDNRIEAENSLIHVLKLDPDNEDAFLKLAKHYIISHNYEDVKIYLDKALFKNNLNAQAYELYGFYYLEQGDTARAVGSFNRAIEIDDNLYESYLSLAFLYDLRNNPVAIDYYKNAIRTSPNNLFPQYKLAYYLQEKSGKIDEAMEMYDAILEKEPQYYDALHNKGYIYMVYKKDLRMALDYFSQAVEVSDRTTPNALFNMAYCLELMDNKKEARRLYKQILEVFPDYKLAIEGQRRVGRYEL